MRIDGRPYRTIWPADDRRSVTIIDQAALPHAFRTLPLASANEVARAIREMHLRGAPLIGVAAAYGLALAIREDASDAAIDRAASALHETRPTAVNLKWALDSVRVAVRALAPGDRADAAWTRAREIAEDDVATCRSIGEHGAGLLREIAERRKGEPIRVLTHCNAGWLATVDWGTALAPVYRAFDDGLPIHVWVDETRPRNQGLLTAWELGQHGVPHTLVADNAGGHLMQRGLVDCVIVGTDRTTRTGDVCNKIGTYLKALAAHDNGVPFYVGLPHSTLDWTLVDGVREIPIEERDGREVREIAGIRADGAPGELQLVPPTTKVANPAFDVTPARLVTALITERGVAPASEAGLLSLYPERRP
jgi:methylthioribose-1-phosphate isomerase